MAVRVNGRALALLLAPAAAVLAAGCGGSGPASVASLGTESTGVVSSTRAASARPSSAAFASCMTLHGFQSAVGNGAGVSDPSLHLAGVTIGDGADPSSPRFQTAMAACHTYLPGGGPPPVTPAQKAATAQLLSRFAACMRKHGLSTFPDPDGSTGLIPPGALSKLDPQSPSFQKAYAACRSIMESQRGGPSIVLAP